MGDPSTISVNGVSQSNVYLNFHWEEGENTRKINGITHPQLDKELMTPILKVATKHHLVQYLLVY